MIGCLIVVGATAKYLNMRLKKKQMELDKSRMSLDDLSDTRKTSSNHR